MTTFWLTFNDSKAASDKAFLGVAIFDMDENDGRLSMEQIVRHAWELGVNPGGCVMVQEAAREVPDEYKNKILTDDEVLLKLAQKDDIKST